jgi:hypothetical protein
MHPWEAVEAALGTQLPTDYKRFIDHYGTGCVCPAGTDDGSLIVYNLRGVPYVVKWVGGASGRYDLDRAAGYASPYSPYPARNGLLAWATTPAGDFFNWRTSGDPDQWDVVFYYFNGCEFVPLPRQNFSRVIVDLLQGKSKLTPRHLDPGDFEPPCQFMEERW